MREMRHVMLGVCVDIADSRCEASTRVLWTSQAMTAACIYFSK